MKSIVATGIIAVLSLAAVSANAGEKKITRKQVPAAVVAAFEKAYPSAAIKGYAREEEDGNTYYEIESVDGKTRRDVLYRADGTVEELEEAITLAALPEAVRSAIKKEYGRSPITGVEKTLEGGTVHYEVHMTTGASKHEVVFNEDGTEVTREDEESEQEKN
jgi:Putative beta-lactamase-inhibitor-like, PepSY-like